jgi:cell division protein FtsW
MAIVAKKSLLKSSGKTGGRKSLFDVQLLSIIGLLLGFGLIVLYSASAVLSYSKFKTNTYFFFHQLLYGVVIGLIAMYICSKIDYKKWQKWTPIIVLLAIGLLIAVLLPHGFGYEVGDSKRWLLLGPISVQPAEFAKLALILYLASWIDKRNKHINSFLYGVIPALAVTGIIAFLIANQPDIGTMLVVGAVALVMLFVGGSQAKHLAWILFSTAISVGILVKLEPYRVERIITFLNPSHDPLGIGYQINQAMVAIGSGGWFGYGYGLSRQKYNFLPEVTGDSIFAIIVEELGFLGALFTIVLFLLFAFKVLSIAQRSSDTFGRMVCVGVVAWICCQAFLNIGAITGVLPLTGVPLPFMSYGSSSLVMLLASMGILLNISKHRSL